ncbi:uncharacterized protein [Procambarus clarkii]|uniref:uncharacterized protein n=1 Tax=Procambarus clarkii TaxID=6728 RepID=UPI0037424C8B
MSDLRHILKVRMFVFTPVYFPEDSMCIRTLTTVPNLWKKRRRRVSENSIGAPWTLTYVTEPLRSEMATDPVPSSNCKKSRSRTSSESEDGGAKRETNRDPGNQESSKAPQSAGNMAGSSNSHVSGQSQSRFGTYRRDFSQVTVENKRRNTGDALKPKTGSTTPTEEGSEPISSGNTPGGEHKAENGNPVKTNSAHGRSEDDRKISRLLFIPPDFRSVIIGPKGYKTNVEKAISKINLIIEDHKKLLAQREEEKAKREEEKAKREEEKAKREERKAKREEERPNGRRERPNGRRQLKPERKWQRRAFKRP